MYYDKLNQVPHRWWSLKMIYIITLQTKLWYLFKFCDLIFSAWCLGLESQPGHFISHVESGGF